MTRTRGLFSLSPSTSVALLAAASLSGCFLSHEPRKPPPPCTDAPPRCVRREAPCDALQLVDAECSDDESWVCPAGASLYQQVWADELCLPLLDELHPLMSDGVNEAPVPIPIEGQCQWVFPTGDGAHLASVDVADRCGALAAPRPVSARGEGFDYLAVGGAFVDVAGATRVLSRGWINDPDQVWGVRADGAGIARVRGRTLELEDRTFFDTTLDLGDAVTVDGGFVYAYGCPGVPHWLEEDCIVGRAPLAAVDDRAAWQTFGARGWGKGEPVRVFGSGPHRGGVARDPRDRTSFLHIYAIGFGRTIELTTAKRPEGPWTPSRMLVPCDLPERDPEAYCAGPNIHLELFDPTRPDELVVSYSVGTLAEEQTELRRAHPEDYWPRVVRVRR